ncbi:biotin synthase BioB [Mucilaginibacter terrae]|uniref:biotin synthase BioB n=1 Tax=Mucilaginibacter terrae TaxID=1955052 RepID=UPI0036301EFD
MTEVRHDWTKEEISEIYHTPLLDLIYKAATIHRENKDYSEVQISSLISVKTGGCPEDCAYCPQAARFQTGVNVHAILPKNEVVAAAQKAKAGGASRLCMGAAWREVRDNRDFDKVIEMVKAVNELDMEVCCTLGMLNEQQAQRLADAGLYAYNHNLDTSEEDYKRIITTRTYDDRLNTIENVRKAKITVCSGGIIGLGETVEDRISMLKTLSNMAKHPESVPVNALVPVQGTPLADQPRVSVWDMVRMIATARIIMPRTQVRLSAGRTEMSTVEQALCFMAGASSIFAGEKLLTTPNPSFDEDMAMFELLGLTPRKAFKNGRPNQVKEVEETTAY